MHFCLLQLFLSQILFLIVVYVQEKIVKVLEKLIQKFPIYQPSASISQQSNGIRIIWFRHKKYFYILKMIWQKMQRDYFWVSFGHFWSNYQSKLWGRWDISKKALEPRTKPSNQIQLFLIPDALCS